MKTAEEILMHNLAGYENILGNLKSSIVEGMKEYAKEAIKADRESLLNRVRILYKEDDEISKVKSKKLDIEYLSEISASVSFKIDKNSIIKAPNIKLL